MPESGNELPTFSTKDLKTAGVNLMTVEDGDQIDLTNDNSDMKGDEWNIALLFFLYVLQGIPLGLTTAIPMYLQNRGVSYRQQVSMKF